MTKTDLILLSLIRQSADIFITYTNSTAQVVVATKLSDIKL